MEKHPIENIMAATLENIRDMVDVNTVIGEPIPTSEGSTIIPLSRVSFGFVAGGGEYAQKAQPAAPTLPFAAGTGAASPCSRWVFGGGQRERAPAARAVLRAGGPHDRTRAAADVRNQKRADEMVQKGRRGKRRATARFLRHLKRIRYGRVACALRYSTGVMPNCSRKSLMK